jgi:diguanylate cyclase (GGDEF)-like protein
MWQDIKNNGIWKGEILDRKKNGDNYAASESIIAVKDKDGVIINYIGISHDITQTKENEEHIKQLAYYDFLTKLPNRKLFEQEVESFIKSSRYNERKLALLFLDLDNFKWVNDSLGHHYGDRILLHVSNLLKATLTQETALARLGGDEFVIITPYQDLLSVSQLATKIINTLRYPIALDKHEINLSWSIGVSLFPENGTTYGTLLQNADTAMYKAKERGKNTFKYFNPTMNELAKRRLNLDSRLRFAASHNEFTLAYQPKYTYTKDKTEGFEALIRWNDSKLGSVAPDEFISVAEQSGYIYEIGHWVLQRAMQDLKTIQSQMEDESYTMAINISGKQLEDSRFVKDVKKLLEKNKILKHTIEFEITETAVMQNIQKVIPVLEAFKELGIKLSIDDFGTGYSSMAYLKKMPLNTLKIDREFIKDIHEDNEDRAIVEATIALAKALKLNIVAEGVETKEHLEILKEMQCDTIQGFFYSRPIPLEELLLFLKS